MNILDLDFTQQPFVMKKRITSRNIEYCYLEYWENHFIIFQMIVY